MVSAQETLGMLMLNTSFKRLPGDIGHPDTFAFPIDRLVVDRATSANVVVDADARLLDDFIEGAHELEKRGVRGIVTSCGFLSRWQRELAACVNVPVATSSLLLLPLVSGLVGERGEIGVITASRSSLDEACFVGCGADCAKVCVAGMDGTSFFKVYVDNEGEPDRSLFQRELRDRAISLIDEHAGLRAILLECTNLPPFAAGLSEEIGMPVFDANILVRLLYAAVSR